ncbi:PqiC family protein [Sulfitobacter aestuariivivens]|uniref:Membrane integrity-associated transporter subunit PqiC n=1 Tax=Sulfitobacter aestuariivivens TaxID=2766981 RepID=A0A927HG37_9RHOB|nr:ABC-type transport auxiliary lipoprotein family protein [Sulfitobacter aestuariivivens]MBD3665093.1 membrane integrity-associated transporter subunit PqiC [Sulfitobacter aestuariivivens]
MAALRTLILGFVLLLAACGGSAERFAVSTPSVVEEVRIGFASVEVRDVSLPTYAASDEIHLQSADGRLTSSTDVLWADDPERAVALEISQNLARMTKRRIASEPWPFQSFPDARLELRFAELVATTAGQFRASGQYFVAVENGGRERSGLFDLSVPFDPEAGPTAIAAARGQLILDLAAYVARNGLR